VGRNESVSRTLGGGMNDLMEGMVVVFLSRPAAATGNKSQNMVGVCVVRIW
jgi:hypothetical protein